MERMSKLEFYSEPSQPKDAEESYLHHSLTSGGSTDLEDITYTLLPHQQKNLFQQHTSKQSSSSVNPHPGSGQCSHSSPAAGAATDTDSPPPLRTAVEGGGGTRAAFSRRVLNWGERRSPSVSTTTSTWKRSGTNGGGPEDILHRIHHRKRCSKERQFYEEEEEEAVVRHPDSSTTAHDEEPASKIVSSGVGQEATKPLTPSSSSTAAPFLEPLPFTKSKHHDGATSAPHPFAPSDDVDEENSRLEYHRLLQQHQSEVVLLTTNFQHTIESLSSSRRRPTTTPPPEQKGEESISSVEEVTSQGENDDGLHRQVNESRKVDWMESERNRLLEMNNRLKRALHHSQLNVLSLRESLHEQQKHQLELQLQLDEAEKNQRGHEELRNGVTPLTNTHSVDRNHKKQEIELLMRRVKEILSKEVNHLLDPASDAFTSLHDDNNEKDNEWSRFVRSELNRLVKHYTFSPSFTTTAAAGPPPSSPPSSQQQPLLERISDLERIISQRTVKEILLEQKIETLLNQDPIHRQRHDDGDDDVERATHSNNPFGYSDTWVGKKTFSRDYKTGDNVFHPSNYHHHQDQKNSVSESDTLDRSLNYNHNNNSYNNNNHNNMSSGERLKRLFLQRYREGTAEKNGNIFKTLRDNISNHSTASQPTSSPGYEKERYTTTTTTTTSNVVGLETAEDGAGSMGVPTSSSVLHPGKEILTPSPTNVSSSTTSVLAHHRNPRRLPLTSKNLNDLPSEYRHNNSDNNNNNKNVNVNHSPSSHPTPLRRSNSYNSNFSRYSLEDHLMVWKEQERKILNT